jgi:hypothetical protein
MNRQPLYVGYAPRMPVALARFLRRVVALVVLGVIVGGIVWVAAHRPYDEAHSDAHTIQTFEGIFLTTPVPQLVIPRPDGDGFSRYLVIGRGKRGPKPEVLRHAGGWASLRGSLAYRDDVTALIVESAETIERPEGAVDIDALPAADDLGTMTLRGEIVDSKCFLGVMRPGSTKVHRQCATRCIAGGVPPVLLVRTEDGSALYLLLVGPDGESIADVILDYVAEPVEVEGTVVRMDDLLVLRAHPDAIRRI